MIEYLTYSKLKKLKVFTYVGKGNTGVNFLKLYIKEVLNLMTINRRKYLINLADKNLPNKRFCIETIFRF